MGGSWSVYWYNGAIVSSEIARGLDVAELTPSEFVSQNEIDAAKTVHLDYMNTQGQPKFVWPPSFALARAYVDQLERSKCLSSEAGQFCQGGAVLGGEGVGVGAEGDALTALSTSLNADVSGSCDGARVQKLSNAVKDLANVAS